MSDNNLPPSGPPPPISKPSYDPGWNDPPTFHYANSPSINKPKLNLNKRVAFPMQSTTSDTSGSNIAATTKVKTSASGLPLPFAKVQQQPPPPVVAPPMTKLESIVVPQPLTLPPPAALIASPSTLKNPIIPCTPADNNMSDTLAIQTLSDEDQHAAIMNIFTMVLKSNSLDSAKYNEIEKRLNLLNSMWLDSRFDINLKNKLWDIAEALKKEKLSEAMDLYRSLAVDYGSVSSQWSIALRQLIIIKQQKSEALLDNGFTDANNDVSDSIDDQVPPPTTTLTPAIDLLLDTSTSIVKGRIQHV